MRKHALWFAGALIVTVTLASAQTATDISGRWVREVSLGPAMDDVAPEWEEIAMQAGAVTIFRAPAVAAAIDGSTLQALDSPEVSEVHWADGVERSSTRVRTNRACRSHWEGAQFVIECRQLNAGPGDPAPIVYTREVRFVDAEGRLVLDLTWRSDERVVRHRTTFRREKQ